MKKLGIILLTLTLTGCAWYSAQRDVMAIFPKDKTFGEVVAALGDKGYSCGKDELTKREEAYFSLNGIEVDKYSCNKSGGSTFFCVYIDFVDIYQNTKTKEVINMGAQSAPTCIWS